MATALVTGAGGFVGANLVRRLLADGHRVTACVRPGGTPWRLAELRHLQVLSVDLADPVAVRRAVGAEQPERIFHLAAHGAYAWQRDLEAMIDVNVRGTGALLDGIRAGDAGMLVHAGSSSEYGAKDHPARETDPLEPNSSYAVTKAAATHLCTHAARDEGLPVITLRLYSVYGPWEDPGRLMPTLVTRARAGELPNLVEARTARDFVYVDDVVDAFVRAASSPAVPGAVLNVGSGRQTTLAELVDIARRVLGIDAEPVWESMAGRDWDTTVWVGDVAAAGARLGWSAQTPLGDGLALMARWLEHRPELLSRYAVA